jgi:hypothetical protein
VQEIAAHREEGQGLEEQMGEIKTYYSRRKCMQLCEKQR